MKRCSLLAVCLAVVFSFTALTGCMRADSAKRKVRAFVSAHEQELNAVIDELCVRYSEELRSSRVCDITAENLKEDCPVIASFFAEYAEEGYKKITLLKGGYVELVKSGATGNSWTYVGFYHSPSGQPLSFFDGELKETDPGCWEETKEDSDNSSESESLGGGWFAFVMYF